MFDLIHNTHIYLQSLALISKKNKTKTHLLENLQSDTQGQFV